MVKNGQKQHENIYRAGGLEGIRKKWRDNGQQIHEANYKAGKTDGTMSIVNEEEALYRDGKLIQDTIKKWARDGELK